MLYHTSVTSYQTSGICLETGQGGLLHALDGGRAISHEMSEDFSQATWPYIPHNGDINT
jgi:hypothetical protein